jgi:hopanoid biosynthesis associated RND transporter like protein HpnN
VSALIARIVAASVRRPWITLAAVAAVCAIAAIYASRHVTIDADVAKLITEDAPWRQREIALHRAFPHREDLIAVVIDAATPEAAEDAAAALAGRLSSKTTVFRAVWRPDGGAFFDRAGLLFQSPSEVAQTLRPLIAAQPLLGALAADPSLRGLVDALARIAEGSAADPARSRELIVPLTRLSAAFESVAAGRTSPLSWRNLISGQAPGPRELRRFILVQPVLDYGALQPGGDASAAIRNAVRTLRLDDEGSAVRVRLTGSVPLADEEFATLAEGATLNVALMIAALLTVLWAAVRSSRLVVAIVLNLAVGLIVTAAFGLYVFGAFNLISVAFAVLFVGLGVDFGIQYAVSYRAMRFSGHELNRALRMAAEQVGGALALAAASIAAGFYAFLPTDYRGVSELGVIAGTGMIIAFIMTITVLPALIALLRPSGEHIAVGYPSLAPLDRFLQRNRRRVVAGAVVVAAASATLLPWLRFDFNPLHLKSPKAESVSTLLDLMRDPTTTPDTINVLVPSVDAAVALARRLEQLPEVDHAMTVASFVPERQAEKLASIEDAALLLDPVLNPSDVAPPPGDDETQRAMLRAATALDQAAAASPEPEFAATAARLGAALRAVARGDAALRERARTMLMPGLTTTLAQLRAAVQARPVTLADLPAEIRRDWVSADGRARVEVYPRGDANDNATLERFMTAVRALAPEATGAPVSIQESSRTVVRAFLEAGCWALASITALLALALRRVRDVLLTLAPLALSGVATLGICAATGLPLNFENIIALPLLFGIGVAFSIYYVIAWRDGRRELLQSSLTRAVIFSALATGTAFGSLWLSHHPGTSSMGRLLALSLACTLASTLLFLPALLGLSQARR